MRCQDDEGATHRLTGEECPVRYRLLEGVSSEKARPRTLNTALEFEPDGVSARAGGNAINFDARIRDQGPAMQRVSIVRQQLVALFGELSTLDSS
jgi:hypothetical protein